MNTQRLTTLSLLLLCMITIPCWAEPFKAGEDYLVMSSVTNLSPSEKTEVVEFFNYGCPACFNLEASIETWLQHQHKPLTFRRIPVIFHPEWEIYAKAYYAGEALKLSKVTPIIFDSLHKQNLPLDTNPQMIAFFVKNFGVNPQLAESLFLNSTTIDLEIKNGMREAGQLNITRIPAFVVNRQFKTDLGMAKTPERLMQILDFLVQKEATT